MKALNETASFIESKCSLKPKVGIVLGSGLGKFADRLKDPVKISYSDIPNFLPTTVEGHSGTLVLGKLDDVPVVVLQGRLHYYEGHAMKDVVFPTRTLCRLGIETIVLTNSSGGINPSFREGDVMLITDHINFTGTNPLIGPNFKDLGPRFPDMSETYHPELREKIKQVAGKLGINLQEGVYAGVSGPTYETPAEVRMLRTLGGDAVGMSTVPEAIAANHLGVQVVGLACITNLAAGVTKHKLNHKEVVENAAKVADQLIQLLESSIPELLYKG